MTIKSDCKIVYDTDNLHIVTNIKNLLEYSDDFSRSVAKHSLWYLDTNGATAGTNTGFEARRLQTQAVNNDGTGGRKDVSGSIPLNHYNFFENLGDKIQPPMQLQI